MAEQRRRSLVLALCCLAQFMIILDISIVNVALPSISADLGFSQAGLQWVVSAYTLTFAGFLMLGGRAGDLLGRREVFVAGLLLFSLASLLGGIAQNEGMLLAGRALQGLGGAVIAPASLSILTTTFVEGAERNRALGLWAAMGGVGGTAGALLGGLLTQELSWRWILLINVPVGTLAALAALRVIVSAERDTLARRSFDLPGALTVTAGLVVTTYGIVETESYGWGSTRTLLTLALGVVLLGLFALIEGRLASAPLVPLRIFGSRRLTGANLVVMCMGGAVFAMWFFMSLYLQEVLGYTPLRTGLAFIPMTGAIIVFSQVSGRLVSAIGPGKVLTCGMTSIGLGMVGFSFISADGSYLSDILVPSLLTAGGLGMSFVPATIAATMGVKGAEAGLASGLINTSRQVGGSIGLALLATLATQHTADVSATMSRPEALTEGFQHAFVWGSGIAFTGAVVSLLLLVIGARGAVPAKVQEIPEQL
jgi:EmrB/QacA subfamily drug resistance transporter